MRGAGLVSRVAGRVRVQRAVPRLPGTGRIVDDPCPECGGDGVSTKTRTLTVRIPAGVNDDQRIRLAEQGEPGAGGGHAGDLYVRVHVTPHPVFGRTGNDLTLKVPVTFTELALGTTLDGADAGGQGVAAGAAGHRERPGPAGARQGHRPSATARPATCW